MQILNKYVAIGTQLKVERPGKAAAITSCDTIDGPVVKLDSGEVVRIDSEKKAREAARNIKEILFLGDILFNYGDFFNRAHPLVPPGYCEEWWLLDLEKACVDRFGALDKTKLAEAIGISPEAIEEIMARPLDKKITASTAIKIAKATDTPLYPYYTYYWRAISPAQITAVADALKKANKIEEDGKIARIILHKGVKRQLELAGVPHGVAADGAVILGPQESLVFLECFGKANEDALNRAETDSLAYINALSNVKLADKGGVFIGARMGRPEKAKQRKLTGSPHTLFPVGDEGGRLRCFQSAIEAGKITAEFPVYHCEKCDRETIFAVCEKCGKQTKSKMFCSKCGLIDEDCKKRDSSGQPHRVQTYREKTIDILEIFDAALKQLGMPTPPDLVKGVRGTSNKDHVPENLVKGILRAKHDLYVNKDGTIRYDMTQLPLTHFKPKEIGTPVKKLIELGYKKDIYQKDLVSDEQVVEIKPQDIVLPLNIDCPEEGADKVLLRSTNFVDELLVKFYGQEKYYGCKKAEDLPGVLVMALAPHTSAGIICRVIGFSKTQGFFAHPLIHAATRRDCDGDEASITLLLDSLLNFSRAYLPGTRGATQDAPLVLTSKVIPSEVDDMILDVDTPFRYPREFYEACQNYAKPWEVKIEQMAKRLNTPKQYEGLGFTHNTSDINAGVLCSAYKLLPSMEEKLRGQMDLAERIRAVDEADVARLVIEKHFLRDIKGNLRKFSTQVFRCVKCNEKYRRPPLKGKCTRCGGKIIFTVSEGSIIKYLEPAISLAKKYSLPNYINQTLEITKRRVEGIFGKDKEKQAGLGAWFG